MAGNNYFLSQLNGSATTKDIQKLNELISINPKFSAKSKAALLTCHPLLIVLFNHVVDVRDCTIIEGHRGMKAQATALKEGNSSLPWPEGKHNKVPSLAVDVQPYPYRDGNEADFFHFGGVVIGVAAMLNIKVRWGRNWDQDNDWTEDQKLKDFFHWELVI